MAKTKISQFDSNPVNNTDIDGINLAEGMAPGLVNNAIRELMSQLKDLQTGAAGDDFTVGGNLSVTGTSTIGNIAITGTATVSGRSIDALPSGTKMLFQQTAAPVGWTKDTTNNDKALRVVSGTAGSGGTSAFSTVFSGSTVGHTTLTTNQMPSHNHSFSGSTGSVNLSHSHGVSDPGHAHTYVRRLGLGGGGGNDQPAGGLSNVSTSSANTGISISSALGSHSHSVSGSIGSTGGAESHTHDLELSVQYIDVIVATKD